MIDLNDLQLFVRVVELNSFSSAARALALPVSAVSRRIARLEQRLGVQLLHRTTRQLRLTEPGLAYFRSCEQALSLVSEAEREVAGMDATPRGELRISLPIAFGRFAFTQLLGDFCRRYPDLCLTAVLSNRYVDLVDEGFDVVVRTGRLAPSSLRARHLADCPFVVAASPACLRRDGRPSVRDAFQSLPCLVLGEAVDAARWTFCEGTTTVVVNVKPAMVSNDMGPLREAALADLGFLMAPGFIVGDDLAAGRLEAINGDWELVRGEVHAVYPARRQTATKVRVLIDFLRERLASTAYWVASDNVTVTG